MNYKRRFKTMKAAGIRWKLQSLVPADFFNCKMWPFCMIKIDGQETKTDKLREMFKGEGLKDKRIEEEDQIIEEAMFQAIFKGVLKPHIYRNGFSSKYNFDFIKNNEYLYGRLMEELTNLSYNINLQKEMDKYPILITQDFARMIIHCSRRASEEPYVIWRGDDIPALYNPIRWDFNLIINGYAAELESKEMTNITNALGKR